MIKIIYTNKDFRHILDLWEDNYPNYKDDISFLEIKNKYIASESVIITNGNTNIKGILFINDSVISFSDSPFCNFYKQLLEDMKYGIYKEA